MASRTLDVGTLYPDGTTLNAYVFGPYVDNPDGTAPPAATATAVTSGGTVTFTGLADGTRYYGGTGTGGYQYFGFSTPAASTSSSSSGPFAPYLGPVSSRGRVPAVGTISSGTYKQYMSWRAYRAIEDIPAAALVYAGFSGTGEATATATGTVEASVEYPVGTITRVTFGTGQTQGTIPAGGQVRSDLTTLTTKIPASALFWVGTWVNWDAGTQVPRHQDGLQYLTALATSLREASTASATTITNNVMTGSRSLGGAISGKTGDSYGPCAVLGMTRRPTVFLCGDSHTQAQFPPTSNAQDTNLIQGILEDIVGNRLGYINAGTGSDSYILANTGNAYANRLILSGYCTHIIDGYGVNDSYATSNATWVANAKTFRAKFPQSKPYLKTTVIPKVNGGWTLADGSDQSPAGNTINYNANNESIRGLLDGTIDGYIELEDVTSLGRGTGLIKGADRVVTDGAITAATNVFTSATAKFNAGDVGKYVGIAGAGAAGAYSIALIKTITNATTVVLSTGDDSAYTATTTVSGATVGIGLQSGDGIHQTKIREKAIREDPGAQRAIGPILSLLGASSS